MCHLFESIQIREGVILNSQYHETRMNQSSLVLFGKKLNFSLSSLLLPITAREGIVKCRILYSNQIEKIEFQPYIPREIKTIKLVYDNEISYEHKFEDRARFAELLKQKGAEDEILIVKNGQITDTSFSNVVFRNGKSFFTPKSYLLNGTRRQQLLQEGMIKKIEMPVEDLRNMESIILINAMLDLKNGPEINNSSVIS